MTSVRIGERGGLFESEVERCQERLGLVDRPKLNGQATEMHDSIPDHRSYTSPYLSTSISAQHHRRFTIYNPSLLHTRSSVPRSPPLADAVYHLLTVHDDLRPVNLRPYHCDRISTRRPRPTKEPGYGSVDTGDRGYLAERRFSGYKLSSLIQFGLVYVLYLCSISASNGLKPSSFVSLRSQATSRAWAGSLAQYTVRLLLILRI